MKASFWLAWRELINRKSALFTGMAMVGVAVALCAATELVSRAREAAVAAEIDHIGPALRLIPAGRSADDLARFQLGADALSISDAKAMRDEVSRWVRALDWRLLSSVPVEGEGTPVIGIDPRRVKSPFDTLGRLGDGQAALGADLATRLRKELGDDVVVKGERFRIAGILPETASGDDLAVFLPLGRLQDLLGVPGKVNEIRVFPAPGAQVDRIASYLKSRHANVNVINTYRGDTAEHKMGDSLRQHRRVLYIITALIIALCILIWSYLNAGERKLEMATVVAIGGTGLTVLSMLVMRAAIVGFLGALAGYGAGALISLAQDFESTLVVVFSWRLLLVTTGGAVALSVLGALVGSTFCAFRQHVAVLQEW